MGIDTGGGGGVIACAGRCARRILFAAIQTAGTGISKLVADTPERQGADGRMSSYLGRLADCDPWPSG